MFPGPAKPPIPEGLQGDPSAPPPAKSEGQKIRNLLTNKDFNQMSLKGQIEYLGTKFPQFKDISPGEFQIIRNRASTSPIEDVSGDVAGILSAPKMATDIAFEGVPAVVGAARALGKSKAGGLATDVAKTAGKKFFPKTRSQFREIRAERAAREAEALGEPKLGAKAGTKEVPKADEVLGAPGKPAAEKPPVGEDYYEKLTESIRQAAQAKDKKVAEFLKSKGINKVKWDGMGADEKNKLIKQVAPSHRSYGSDKASFRFGQIAKLLEP